jgi:hypothetical protein
VGVTVGIVMVTVGSAVGGVVGTVVGTVVGMVVGSVVGTVVGTVVSVVTGSWVTGGGMVIVGVSVSTATCAVTATQNAHTTRSAIRIARHFLTVSLPVMIHQETAIYM